MLKPIAFQNGWIFAPHCWKTYLMIPIRIDRTPSWTAVSVFGFVTYWA
jgi:hypothetical protein